MARNPEKHREANRRHREAHREERREKDRERQRHRYAANPGKAQAAVKRYQERIRTAVFDHYGWACACCGSADQLCIDHVNGDGARHRKEIGGSGTTLHRWLVRNEFPPGFQTLCRSCNRSKAVGSACGLNHDRLCVDVVVDNVGGAR